MNRWHVLIPALMASLALLVFGEQPVVSTEVVSAVPSRGALPAVEFGAVGKTDPDAALPRLLDRSSLYPPGKADSTRHDLFAGHTWAAATAQVDGGPPAAIEAPSFPFTVLGKKLESGTWEVFLAKEEATMVLKEGQIAEQAYQVVKIAPPTMTVVYLPMNHTYSVSIGEAE
jgi:hypothetical protein